MLITLQVAFFCRFTFNHLHEIQVILPRLKYHINVGTHSATVVKYQRKLETKQCQEESKVRDINYAQYN